MDLRQTDGHPDEIDDKAIEIRLTDIWTFLRRARWRILLGALVGSIVGGIYAFTQPNQYSSQVTVMPEIQAKSGSGLGNLGSLAGLAGINLEGLTSVSEAIRPDLYPTVMQSVPFTLYLLQQPVISKGVEKKESLETFLLTHNSFNLITWLSHSLSLTKKDEFIGNQAGLQAGVLLITKEQEEQVKQIQQLVSMTYDKKTGIVTIAATMPDPIVAATVAQQALDYLTNYITSYRTEKARKEVDFLSQQVLTAQKRYQQAELNLSSYRDRNRNLYLNTAKIEEQRIQAEFLLAQELYNSLTKQHELAKIKVQEQTPVFKVLNPAQVPLRKSKPGRMVMVAMSAIVGALMAMVIIFIRTRKKR